METVPEAPDESSGNSTIVKSDDGNPQPEGGRSSPPPNCAICLGRCRNKSFTDSCLHQFCFKCLLTWSRVKTECPLCKQNFKSIIHNVKSNHQYEEYPVHQPQNDDRERTLDFNQIVNAARRFRYSALMEHEDHVQLTPHLVLRDRETDRTQGTTLTLPRRETLAIQQFLMHYPLAALVNELPPRGAGGRERSRRSPADFRRTVYRHNLWARPLPDFTGRFRDCSPEFFRYNDSQIHRLIPWLNRELYYLLNENSGHITYVVGRIVELLPQCAISSAEFRAAVACYFGERTDHFLHEFHVFASTPYDITGYDRHVQYRTEARPSALVSEVLSSSDSDSHDSDIVMVASSHPAGPSRQAPSAAPQAAPQPPAAAPAPSYPRGYIPQPAVIPIETISHSDSDSDSSGVMVVGYIKPPHQRTPELVDLLGSDSDVVVHEPAAATAPAAAAAAARDAEREPLVRVKMSVPRGADTSDGDTESYEEPPRHRSHARYRHPIPYPTARRPLPDIPSLYATRTPPFSSDDEDSSEDTTDESSSSADARRNRKKKPRRKAARGTSKRRERRSPRSPRQRKNRPRSEEKQSETETRRKDKSRNGKGVKSSDVNLNEIPLPPSPTPSQPGPSGVAPGSKRKYTDRTTPRRGSRESKRLKSVVKVMKKIPDPSAGAGSSKTQSADRDGSPSDSKKRPKTRLSAEARNASRFHADQDSTSSDDNIPLRLAMSRVHPISRASDSD